MKLNFLTLLLLAVVAVLFSRQALAQPWTTARIVGIAIAVVGLAFLVVARIQLGRAFSIQAKASSLVSTGIYSRIRNPIYVSGALLIFGLYIWSGYRWWLLLFLAALIPLQIIRSRKESRVLEEKFGSEYLEYKRKTWF